LNYCAARIADGFHVPLPGSRMDGGTSFWMYRVLETPLSRPRGRAPYVAKTIGIVEISAHAF